MSTQFRGRPSVTLTGFMFSGKSSVGRSLAGQLGLGFVDLDMEIIRRAGCPIEEIFKQQGEEAFRALEREVIEQVLPVPAQVVSAGGGAVCDEVNRHLIARHSCIVWLKVSVQTVLERLSQSRGRPRPLLQVEDPEAEAVRLLAEREKHYSKCDFHISTDRLSVPEVVERIVRGLQHDKGNVV